MVADANKEPAEVKKEHEYEKKQDGGNFKPVSILKKASRLAEARNKEVRRERRAVVTLMSSQGDLEEGARITSGLDEEETEDFVDQGKWRSGVDDSEDSAVGGDVASLEFGDSAPAPGSFADREHRKWVEEAVVLPNNPYTTENIVRRRTKSITEESLVTLRALSDAAERTANVGEDGKEERKGLYAAIYKRDYYVNNVDANGGNLEGKEQCLGSSGDEEEISQKKDCSESRRDSDGGAGRQRVKQPHDHRHHQPHLHHLQPDSLEPGNVADMHHVGHHNGLMEEHGLPGDRDSGLSTEGSQQSEPPEEELMTISVSQEVKRFQQEINKVAIENTRFHHWKKTRAPVGPLHSQHTVARRSASFESLVEVANPMLDPKISSIREEQPPPCLPPRSKFTSQDSLLSAPALPPRSKTSKRVSYAPQEATVLGSPPDSNLVDLHNKSLERRQRQIFPSTHMAPNEPPAEEERELAGKEEEHKKVALREEENEEPVLPSVRQLASRFQAVTRPDSSASVGPAGGLQAQAASHIRKEEVAEKVPAMLKVKKQSGSSSKYSQVHSITARSVSREFREGLKAGKPALTDTIFKLPEARNALPTADCVSAEQTKAEIFKGRLGLVEGEIVRSVSPELARAEVAELVRAYKEGSYRAVARVEEGSDSSGRERALW